MARGLFRSFIGAIRGGSQYRKSSFLLDAAGQALMKQAMEELGLSARAFDKVRKISRTIADLESSEKIQAPHVSEAIGYRLLDRKW